MLILESLNRFMPFFFENAVINGSSHLQETREPQQILPIAIIIERGNEFNEQQLVPQTAATGIPVVEHTEIPLWRSQRTRKSAISNDYVVYLNEIDYNIGQANDSITFHEAISRAESDQWITAMEDELKSMKHNEVWELVEILENFKPIGCKWVIKTKKDYKGRIDRYKARLVAKGFTQREGIDYNETFSPVSSKDSFRIIMALVAHFDLELHQTDVKIAFLNDKLFEEVYMTQLEGFVQQGKDHLVCKLNRSLYGLKQAARQWFLKFDQVITSFGFIENKVDQCIYLKISGSKFIFLVLYIDDILLATGDIGFLHETKQFLSKSFQMSDLGESSYVRGIEIIRDRSRKLLGLSQRSYINKVLKRLIFYFSMSSNRIRE